MAGGWGLWLRELPWKGLRKGLKHCLGPVAARVALGRLAGSCKSCLGKACGRVWGVWGRANGSLESLKNRWLGRVAARVALERHAGSCKSCLGKACRRVMLLECEGHGRDRSGSTPPVAPGAAPALAKAGVGGFGGFLWPIVGIPTINQ